MALDAMQAVLKEGMNGKQGTAGEGYHGDEEGGLEKHGGIVLLQIAAAQNEPAREGEDGDTDGTGEQAFKEPLAGVPEHVWFLRDDADAHGAAHDIALGNGGGLHDVLQEVVRHSAGDIGENFKTHAKKVQDCWQHDPDAAQASAANISFLNSSKKS